MESVRKGDGNKFSLGPVSLAQVYKLKSCLSVCPSSLQLFHFMMFWTIQAVHFLKFPSVAYANTQIHKFSNLNHYHPTYSRWYDVHLWQHLLTKHCIQSIDISWEAGDMWRRCISTPHLSFLPTSYSHFFSEFQPTKLSDSSENLPSKINVFIYFTNSGKEQTIYFVNFSQTQIKITFLRYVLLVYMKFMNFISSHVLIVNFDLLVFSVKKPESKNLAKGINLALTDDGLPKS